MHMWHALGNEVLKTSASECKEEKATRTSQQDKTNDGTLSKTLFYSIFLAHEVCIPFIIKNHRRVLSRQHSAKPMQSINP